MLLEEANKVLKLSSSSDAEVVCVRACRETFREIGVEKVCDYQSKVVPVKNGEAQILRNMVRIEDIGKPDSKTPEGYRLERSMSSVKGEYVFYQTPFSLKIPQAPDGQVRIWFWSFYLDENQEMIIPEVCFEAAKLLTQYYGLDGVYDHPEFPNREAFFFKWKNQCAAARGELNASTSAQERLNRRLL